MFAVRVHQGRAPLRTPRAPTDLANRRHAGGESAAAGAGVGAVGHRDDGPDLGRERNLWSWLGRFQCGRRTQRRLAVARLARRSTPPTTTLQSTAVRLAAFGWGVPPQCEWWTAEG